MRSDNLYIIPFIKPFERDGLPKDSYFMYDARKLEPLCHNLVK